MKFFHVGDLHFGKSLHDVHLIDNDQPFWVEQFLKAVDEHNPDAVVIAGDVYDCRNPSLEAMELFDHMLTELAARGKYVFIIPGNHDSSVRLSHVSGLLKANKIYIAGKLEQELMSVTIPGESTDVTFWLMPYLFPKLVSDKKVLDCGSISTYDEAVRMLLSAQSIDKNACNVLIAHQNVLAHGAPPPEHSESETIIGGLGEIECSAFDDFDYVALGHIHNAQHIGRETVRYSGCPLYYDFSEIGRDKSLTMVTVNSKDDIRVERVKIPLLHELIRETGTLDELITAGVGIKDKDKYYIQCCLTGDTVPPHSRDRLQEVYGDQLINIKRIRSEVASADSSSSRSESYSRLSLEEQFGIFYQERHNDILDDIQEKLVLKIREQQTRQGDDFYLEANNVPEADSQELLDLLYLLTAEDDK